MDTGNSGQHWSCKRHAGTIALVVLAYLFVLFGVGSVYPSVRLANPATLGPNVRNLRMADSHQVYLGKRAEVGWPIAWLAWRQEALGPINTKESQEMRIVATRISVLALGLDLLFAITCYCLLVVTVSVVRRPRSSLWLMLGTAISISVLVGIGCLAQTTFIRPIPVYESEGE
jgi:hypothetical protein